MHSSRSMPPGGGRPAGRHRADRRLLLRAAEVLRVRRWPVAGDREPRRGGPHRRDRGAHGPLDPGVPEPHHGSRQQPEEPDLQHARARDTDHARAAGAVDERAGRLAWTTARTKDSSDRIYSWAEASSFASPFVSDPAHRSQVIATIDFDDRSMRRSSPRPSARTASSTRSRTASSAATSCGSRRPGDRAGRRERAARVDRLDRRAPLGPPRSRWSGTPSVPLQSSRGRVSSASRSACPSGGGRASCSLLVSSLSMIRFSGSAMWSRSKQPLRPVTSIHCS